LLVVGLIVFGTAFLVWTLAPLRPPANVNQASQPSTTAPPTIAQAIIITATPAPTSASQERLTLLPQTPLEGDALPSFASVDDAPSTYQVKAPNQPRRLIIPDLEVDAPVRAVGVSAVEREGQSVYQWQVPAGYEVGWHNTSAPLGQAGNTVLNGHNNIYGEVFRDLIDLEIGSELILYDDERSYHYAVVEKELLAENDQPLSVRLENAQLIEKTEDERLTLISCWPYLTNSQRIVVIARPLDDVG
jgi:sortase A